MQLTSLVDLLDIQDLDLQIDRLLDRRQSLPELAQYKKAHEEIEAVKGEHAHSAADLKQLELSLDKSEGELQLLELKLGEHETRLFAGGMSARETEHMRLEVESLRGQKGTMEERVLEMLENIDPARDAVESVRTRLDALNSEKETLETAIKREWKVIDAEVARKEERKKAAVTPVPDDLMELYDKLREMKDGVAVGRFENGVCGGCHVSLSPAEQAQALDAEIPRCVHCRRILVS
jgi:predicted  nucleic acid-binding Zn-ribbon protein